MKLNWSKPKSVLANRTTPKTKKAARKSGNGRRAFGTRIYSAKR